MEQGVLKLDIGPAHTVEQHIEPADRPGRRVIDLTAEAEIRRIATRLLDELATDDEHAARAASGIVNTHSWFGFEDANHEPDDIARGVEVASLFPRRFGEHVDEELVGRAEQIGELKVLIAEPVFAEVANEVPAGIVGDHPLVSLGAHEADVIEHMLQRFVGLAERPKRLVKNAAEGFRGHVESLHQILPTRSLRDEKSVVKIGILRIGELGVTHRHPCSTLRSTMRSFSASKTSEQRFRKSIPKMKSL